VRHAACILISVECALSPCAANPASSPSTSGPASSQPSDQYLGQVSQITQRPLDWCDADWLARALAALPTRKPGGKPTSGALASR